MLFFCKNRHNNQSVQVDTLTKHPEVVAAQQIQMDEHEQLTARLDGGKEKKKKQYETMRLFLYENCNHV